jgi:hypothetical protein
VRLNASNSLLDRIGGFAGKTEHKIIIKDDRTTRSLWTSSNRRPSQTAWTR